MSPKQLFMNKLMFILFLILVFNLKLNETYYEYNNLNNYRRTTLKTVIDNSNNKQIYNTRPIIGILSQELNSQIYRLCTLATYKSYIAASYVKYIESAGARVVPIRIGQPDSYYEEIVNSVNGIILPGDNALLNITNGYGEAAHKIYELIIHYKRIPLLGISLGFQAIIYNALKQQDIRIPCRVHNISLPLIFHYDYTKSNIFKNAPYEIINILKTQSVTANSHSFCVTSKN